LQGHLTDNKQSHVDSDAAQVLASSPKDVLNSIVFSCCRKVASDCTFLTEDGRGFQARAAATGNMQSQSTAGFVNTDNNDVNKLQAITSTVIKKVQSMPDACYVV